MKRRLIESCDAKPPANKTTDFLNSINNGFQLTVFFLNVSTMKDLTKSITY